MGLPLPGHLPPGSQPPQLAQGGSYVPGPGRLRETSDFKTLFHLSPTRSRPSKFAGPSLPNRNLKSHRRTARF